MHIVEVELRAVGSLWAGTGLWLTGRGGGTGGMQWENLVMGKFVFLHCIMAARRHLQLAN
jgi:hypothetical protein